VAELILFPDHPSFGAKHDQVEATHSPRSLSLHRLRLLP
jgi:hypothetical protein